MPTDTKVKPPSMADRLERAENDRRALLISVKRWYGQVMGSNRPVNWKPAMLAE